MSGAALVFASLGVLLAGAAFTARLVQLLQLLR